MQIEHKLLSGKQLRDWDKYTIEKESISSVDLMNRAAGACLPAILSVWNSGDFAKVVLVCGTGNNGGDGLAIARMLWHKGLSLEIYLMEGKLSEDAQIQSDTLEKLGIGIKRDLILQKPEEKILLVDCLFGTGLNRPIEKGTQAYTWIQKLRNWNSFVISVDLPSGLAAEPSLFIPSAEQVVQADITLTFQVPKLSFLFEEWGRFVGKLQVLDIGLQAEFLKKLESTYFLNTKPNGLRKTNSFSHKSRYGHCAVFAGSEGMQGAALLASSAALRTGAGLVTLHCHKENFSMVHLWQPELLVSDKGRSNALNYEKDFKKYRSIVVGSGLGINSKNSKLVFELMQHANVPMVFDADALTMIANELEKGATLIWPTLSVLTPHPGEMKRLLGNHDRSSWQQFQETCQFANQHKVYIVLKGAFTRIICPNGDVYFQGTSNSMLSTAGTGDVLAGIIGGLLSQGLNPVESCCVGVSIHAEAANRLMALGKRTLVASELLEQISYLV